MAEQLKKNSPERYPLQLLVWILGQLAGIGMFCILNGFLSQDSVETAIFRINNVEM